MTKQKRQEKILELVEKKEIDTQEELAALLLREGFATTQATVSRDIRELKLTKVSAGAGKQKYVSLKGQESGLSDKYIRVLREGLISMDRAQNILVVKTVSGMAMAVATVLDALHMEEIVGCIAGDDTVFAALRSTEDVETVMNKIKEC